MYKRRRLRTHLKLYVEGTPMADAEIQVPPATSPDHSSQLQQSVEEFKTKFAHYIQGKPFEIFLTVTGFRPKEILSS